MGKSNTYNKKNEKSPNSLENRGYPEMQTSNEEFVPKSDNQRIIDLLDIQLLIAVIVLFVSAWAYLNSTICDFTTTEPYNERMSFILVHYILTVVLILCISITYVKGKYLLKKEIRNFTLRERRYIDLFIYGWIWALLLCVLILIFNSYKWFWGGIVFLSGLIYFMTVKNKFGWAETLIINLLLILCFPIFISTMVNISKDIVIKTSKNTISDDISITIDPRSYDAKYDIIGLANKDLIKGEHYQLDDNVITTKTAYLIGNRVTVSTKSPASGWKNFFVYPLRKMMIHDDSDSISTYNKTKIIDLNSNKDEND